ncbi:Nuclear factor interleukin-3-regulated protein [Aphelenchoides fujianensis]|nr:Nuclear factor interleukin-3-regulated protein [Aphelenchoides fujianensis]
MDDEEPRTTADAPDFSPVHAGAVNTSTDDADSHADRSDFSTTPPSDRERKSRRSTSGKETERRKRSGGEEQRKSRSKRRLNDHSLEQRLMALAEENHRLKVQLNTKSSVIVAAPSSASSVLHHPLPASATSTSGLFGLQNGLLTANSTAPQSSSIQSAGSAFSVPRSSAAHLEQHPAAFNPLFFPPADSLGLLAPSHSALLSLLNGSPPEPPAAFLTAHLAQQHPPAGFDLPLASLANLQAILHQQQQQLAFFPNFATATATNASEQPASGVDPAAFGLPFLPPALFGPSALARAPPEGAPIGSAAMQFGGLFQPSTSTTSANVVSSSTDGQKKCKKEADESPKSCSRSDRRSSTPASSPDHHSKAREERKEENGAAKSLTRGPGNLHFVGQLPTAQEPRPPVLMHTDGSMRFPPNAISTWTSASTFDPPAASTTTSSNATRSKKTERTPPRSSSAFSAASCGSPTNSTANPSGAPRGFGAPNGPTERPQSLLGSLLAVTSTSRRSPSVPESRTEKQSGLIDRRELEQACLSSLAVNLSTSNAPTSAASSTGGHPSSAGGRSDDSMGSPHSTRSTSDSARSHASRPPSAGHAHDGASTGGNSAASGGDPADGMENSRERYMDRRRRNNEAAKRCRANRRAVFEYRSRRAQQLEAENSDLRQEMLKLNNELEQLKAVIAANSRLLSA